MTSYAARWASPRVYSNIGVHSHPFVAIPSGWRLLWQQAEHGRAGPGDDVGGDEFAEAFDLLLAGFDGGFHRGDVPLITTVM